MSEPAVIESPKTKPPKPKRQPPYTVIIENDDYHTFDYVFELLQKVFKKSQQDAAKITIEIHELGRKQVWTGTKELAELKVEQVKNYGDDTYNAKTVTFPLGCYIEPLPQ